MTEESLFESQESGEKMYSLCHGTYQIIIYLDSIQRGTTVLERTTDVLKNCLLNATVVKICRMWIEQY